MSRDARTATAAKAAQQTDWVRTPPMENGFLKVQHPRCLYQVLIQQAEIHSNVTIPSQETKSVWPVDYHRVQKRWKSHSEGV